MSNLPDCFENMVRLDLKSDADDFTHMYLIRCLDCGGDISIGHDDKNKIYISKHCKCVNSHNYEREILKAIEEGEEFSYKNAE